MNPFYTLRQQKIYSDYKGKSNEFLENAVIQKKYEEEVLEIIKEILSERNKTTAGNVEPSIPLTKEEKDALMLALEATVKKGSRNMTFGTVWFIAGAVVTLVSFSNASDGGSYVLAYGAIIGGLIQFFGGSAQYSKAKNIQRNLYNSEIQGKSDLEK